MIKVKWMSSLVLMSISLLAQGKSHQPVTISIDSMQGGPTIHRQIFGQFAEHLGQGVYGGIWVGPNSSIPNVRGIRSDVVKALKAIKVPNVRWPGGCFADEYHWRNGIGPQNARRATLNSNWGGVVEPNTFGTDEFMDFLHQIGADAYISANVGSGTVKESADWLEYMTAPQHTALADQRRKNGHEQPYKVAFWGIGNESWGCGGAMTASEYLTELKRFARFDHNYNPQQTMQKIAVGPNGDDTAYTDTIMKAWQHHDWTWNIQGLSLHKYTVDGWPPHKASEHFGEQDYVDILKDTLTMKDTLEKHIAIMDKYDPDKKVALVVDEWGAWYKSLAGTNPGFLQQQNSQRDAILAALNLNIFARHGDRVRMANIAQMINVLQALILTDGGKMLLTPTYYIYQLYLPFHDATLIPVRFKAADYVYKGQHLPGIDVIVAKDKQGQLWLAATNLNPHQSTTVQLAIAGKTVSIGQGQVLAANKVDAVNTFKHPHNVVPKPLPAKGINGQQLTLPAESVTVVKLTLH